MTTTMNLKQELIEAGCPTYFIKEALFYFPLYDGNIEKFINHVEQELENIHLCDNLEYLESVAIADDIDMEFDEMVYDDEFSLKYA